MLPPSVPRAAMSPAPSIRTTVMRARLGGPLQEIGEGEGFSPLPAEEGCEGWGATAVSSSQPLLAYEGLIIKGTGEPEKQEWWP